MMGRLRSQPNQDRTKVQWSPTGLQSSSTKVKLLVGRACALGPESKYLEGEKDRPIPDQVCGTGANICRLIQTCSSRGGIFRQPRVVFSRS
jgi:hypothetical protein